MNISLGIKECLRIDNGTQYTNYEIKNSLKNQMYANISHNISLWAACTQR